MFNLYSRTNYYNIYKEKKEGNFYPKEKKLKLESRSIMYIHVQDWATEVPATAICVVCSIFTMDSIPFTPFVFSNLHLFFNPV